MDTKNVIDPRIAKLNMLRLMAGRAFLNGPKRYKVEELEGPLLDLAVANAEGIKATIYLVPNAISPFYECAVLDETGRLHYQFLPSRSWTQGGPIIQRENIGISPPTSRVHRNGGNSPGWGPSGYWSATTWHAGANGRRSIALHETEPLLAAMRCYVHSKFGEEVEL